MKIVHITVVRRLTPGQIKQLKYESAGAEVLSDSQWTTMAFHTGPSSHEFIRTIPLFFRPMLLRKLYGWIVALRLSRNYDIILMRHMSFDPFVIFFAPFIKNRVTIHHSKEAEELRLIRKGWKGRLASFVEQVTGAWSANYAKALVGVTHEIAQYELMTHSVVKPTAIYPNGIDPKEVVILEDKRNIESIQAAFICGSFSDWHGLDKLISAVMDFSEEPINPPLIIHLIGGLSDGQRASIAAHNKLKRVFVEHGVMSEIAYRPIVAQCDFGITSLALERKNLREASTLKVREMLAMGLPVYSGHKDIALPETEPFVFIVDDISVDSLICFGRKVKRLAREEVREKSLNRIKKSEAMRGLCEFTKRLVKQ